MFVVALAPGFHIPAGAGDVTYQVDYTVRVSVRDFNSKMWLWIVGNFDSSDSNPKSGFQTEFVQYQNQSMRETKLAEIANMKWASSNSGGYGWYQKSVNGVMENDGTYSNSGSNTLKSLSGTTFVTINATNQHCQLGILTQIPSIQSINTGARSVIDSLVISPITRGADLEFAQAAAALNAENTAKAIADDEVYEAEEMARIEAEMAELKE